jgi:two-component system, chemotaxis family, sensor kinase CheA
MADDIVIEFLAESNENLDTMDRELVLLEKDPKNSSILGSVFRSIHTIKGTCGFLGFTKLEKVAHSGENLLSNLRDGKLTLNTAIASGLMSMVDAVRRMLTEIQASGTDGENDYKELIESLTRLLQATPGGVPEAPKPASEPAVVPKVALPVAPPVAVASEPKASLPTAVPEAVAPKNEGADAPPGTSAGAQTTEGAKGREAGPGTIRVDVGLLDKLMNLVGELVLARNQVLQFTGSVENANLVSTSQRLNLITTELQEGVMKTRMQPIGNVWSKFPRTVRDVAMNCGKQVRIEMIGQETELDKTIIEAIKDPLTHLVRNSVDHGIERPEVRVAAGKGAEGCLTLRAYHEGGQVNIEIVDDGAGLHHEKIRRKAVEKGLLSAEKAAQLSEREAVNLIFMAGFSTAEKVTNVSGRGVGMDVVKTNIEKIGGTVDVQSAAGKGTTVKMKIPLTLAIVPGLVVVAADKRFVIPQVSLIELVRIDDQARGGIEMVHGVPVYRLRGRLLPLAYLHRELRIEKNPANGADQDNAVNMVVLQADGRQFGLIVDEIKDTEEIVVKPLGKRLKNIKTFAGATIMGDGKVALILDVLGLAQRASIISQTHDRASEESEAASQEKASDKQTFLVFAGPDDARMALPLGTLARLEEFPVSQVERSGAQWVIQYRGQILPLVRLNVVLQERRRRRRHETPAAAATADPGSIQVLVCNHEGHSVGLVVDQILDIVEDRVEVKSPATRPGVLYAAVIENRVTELLDLPAILQTAAAQSSHEHEEEHVKVGN